MSSRIKLLRSSAFFWKLWGSYAALTLVAAILIAWLINRFFSSEAHQSLEAKLDTIGNLAASLVAASPSELWSGRIQLRLQEVSENTGTGIDVVLSSGRVMMESETGLGLDDDVLNMPEIREAHISGAGKMIRQAEGGLSFVYVAKPIVIQSEKIGYVRVGENTDTVRTQSRQLTSKVAMGAGIAAVLSLLGGVVITRGVTRPLRRMEYACRRISEGDLSIRIDTRRLDEFGQVANSVNRMADSLEGQIVQYERQSNRLELLLGMLHDSVVAIDGEGQIMFMNIAAESFVGIDQPNAIGYPFHDICGIPVIAELIHDVFDTQIEITKEVNWGEGEDRRYASVRVSPLLTDNHDMRGVLIVIRDVTQSRRFEVIRRDFTSNVSHELKTPVAAISALLDALDQGAAAEEETRAEFLNRLRVQNDRLNRLIEELLAIARLESAKEILALHPMDLREVVDVARDTFRTMASLRQIDFSVKACAADLPILGDQRALEVVVNSLVDNAFKYTKQGGRIEVSIFEEEGNACIVVEDTGMGIASSHLERIFERFYRVDASRSRGRGGSGLGLAIVKHFAAAHKGSVTATSELGVGSKFKVKLPIAKSESLVAAP